MPRRVLAGRARAAYRPARSPAPGRRSARRLRCLAVLLHAMCAEPRRRPMEEKRQFALAHIGVTGRFREAGGSASAAGRDTVELVSVGGSDHRDWLSAHSAVRRATISFFCCIFERGRDMPQHARLGRCALVGGGGAKMALARRGEVAKARVGRAVVVVVVPPPSLPAAGHTTRTPVSRACCVLVAVTSPSCAAIALFSLFK